jgi:hypothetical protein
MRLPRGSRRTASPHLGPFSYHFSDLDLRETIDIVNRGDCLYSTWRPVVEEDVEEKEMKSTWSKAHKR